MYQKTNQNYTNMISTLEQKILDLKEMETNISTKNILNEAIKVAKDIGINLDDFDKKIEGELNKLNNDDFDGGDNIDDFLPDPQKNKIILNDEEKDKNNNKKKILLF